MSSKNEPAIPRMMRAVCKQCGHRSTGGTVTVWLKKDRSRDPTRITNEPRDDVSYRCPDCEKVTEREVTVLE